MRELVLNFHGLGEPHQGVPPEELPYWLSAASFAYVLDQIVESTADSNPRITVTFDDGNASDALLALPELHKRGLSASFFVCAGRVGRKHYLDKSMIKELLDGGMRIGSHGMDHRDWRTVDALTLESEIVDARRKMEDIIQRPVSTVSLPFGSYGRRVLNRLVHDSWECIYTCDRGLAESSSRVKPRETLDAKMEVNNVVWRLLTDQPLPMRLGRDLVNLYKRLR
jgi:peptidoglycan/xylan/chitin deacetylase (PgdA/CDA1 family)